MTRGYPIHVPQGIKDEILKLRRLGNTYIRISKKIGISSFVIGKILRPDLYEARQERHREKRKERRRNTSIHTTVNGVRGNYRVIKRPRPDGCELCGKDIKGIGRGGGDLQLCWHHWDDNHLERGIWACRQCHPIMEFLDHEGLGLIEKYLRMKGVVVSLGAGLAAGATLLCFGG